MTTSEQRAAVLQVADAVIQAVKAAGSTGAPGGIIYAALMAQGCSLEQYEVLTRTLVNVGMLRKSGQLYYAVG